MVLGWHTVTLPTFFVIGAAKSGTTSLHYYLDEHPQIQMSAIKEPHFFSGPENGIPYPGGRISELAEYERLFDPAAPARGESSPSYSVHPRRTGVPQRINQLVPDARFVYLVRDPIDRTVSHYMHRVAVEGERRSLLEALGDLTDPLCIYTSPSRYASQLELYLAHFRQERILVVDHAELLTHRQATLKTIFVFLGVDDTFDSTRSSEEFGTTRDRRRSPPGWTRFSEWATRSPLRLLPPDLRRAIRRATERALWPPLEKPSLDEDLRSRLAELYADEVARLRAMTGHAFPTWSL